jgi:hypothetical protein
VEFQLANRSLSTQPLELRHNHSLDESDANKRKSLLRGLAQRDIIKGYAPAAGQ